MRRRRLSGLALACAAAMSMAACAGPKLAASVSGASEVIPAPEYEIRGKTAYAQLWIDSAIESGVAGLGWPRPKSFDAPPQPKAKPAPAVAAPKKKSLLKRWAS